MDCVYFVLLLLKVAIVVYRAIAVVFEVYIMIPLFSVLCMVYALLLFAASSRGW